MKASLLTRATPVLLLAAALATGAGTAGLAQTATAPATPPATSAPATPPAAPAPMHHAAATHMRKASPSAAGETMQQMAEHRIADLHRQLGITAAEEAAWGQFAQVMRDNAKDLDQAYQQRAAGIGSMSAVENMQSYAQIEQTRSQDLQKLIPAFQAVYASLSDAQKKQADALFRNQATKAEQHQKHAAR